MLFLGENIYKTNSNVYVFLKVHLKRNTYFKNKAKTREFPISPMMSVITMTTARKIQTVRDNGGWAISPSMLGTEELFVNMLLSFTTFIPFQYSLQNVSTLKKTFIPNYWNEKQKRKNLISFWLYSFTSGTNIRFIPIPIIKDTVQHLKYIAN